MAWAASRGGPGIGETLERAIASTLANPIRRYDGIDLDALHAFGRVTCAEARAVAERGIREVVRPCLARTQRARRDGGALRASHAPPAHAPPARAPTA